MSEALRPCPACGSDDLAALVAIEGMPVHVGGLWPSAEEARSCPRGDMQLVHCRTCQLLYNASFDPEPLEYTHAYDNSLEGSGVFMDFARGLADELIERHGLHDKKVIEIGCGKGAFITLLCERGPNEGIGFDTTYDASAPNPLPDRLRFIKAHYSREQTGGGADLIACRHVLEHIPDPQAFLKMLRESLEAHPETTVYFEVPEVMLIVKQLSIWDLMYEHCTYFGHESLAALFARSGFEVLRLTDYFDDQFLGIEVRPSLQGRTEPPPIAADVRVGERAAAFAEHFNARKAEWRDRMAKLMDAGKRVAIWAAGGKTVSFMNLFQLGEQIDTIVDINPRKQGMHLPGTGHEIFAPDALLERRPDVVIVMNAHYKDEIAADLQRMGLSPEILTA